MKRIGVKAFLGCVFLRHVSTSPLLANVQNEAFSGCEVLESIDLSGVQLFGERILCNCYGLRWLGLPSNFDMRRVSDPSNIFSDRFDVVEAGGNTVAGIPEDCAITIRGRRTISCKDFLEELCVTIDTCDSETRYGVENLQNTWVKAVEDLTFGGTIAPQLFLCNHTLRCVKIPGAKEIGSRAFFECLSLIEFDGPQVAVIHERAFEGCYELKSIRLGWNVRCDRADAVAGYQFKGCYQLLNFCLVVQKGLSFTQEEKIARMEAIFLDFADKGVEWRKYAKCVTEEIQ